MPPFTWLSVSVPGAAEKPYMVEEAVSYNELDYISVSQARGSSHLPRGEGGFVSMGSEPLRLGGLAVMPLAVPPLWVPMSLHGQQSAHCPSPWVRSPVSPVSLASLTIAVWHRLGWISRQ